MKVRQFHRWDATYHEAVAIQKRLQDMLVLRDEPASSERMHTVAGADISFARESGMQFAAVILFSYPNLDILEEVSVADRADFPYIPGFLSFREGPALLKVFSRLRQVPDFVIFDGQGIAHPRGIGLASHLGLCLDLPSIGCAKTILVGSHGKIGDERGCRADLLWKDRVVGAALRTRTAVKPVFVSQGHRISLERAVDLVLSCCKGYRLPEPVRRAHLTVNEMRKAHTETV
ncbi:MAG: deoxyribonuclease V [Deltaproteobacteria bacterium]|nr:deoxyribonuclease V [Deltaproteobacteria bacterium]